MDAQQLLAEFGHIAIAPGGVGRLREMVLALAVSGRLIERPEINKSLAADFLRKLEQELADYKAANKYRRTSRDRDAASMLKIPAPAGWINARLGQIGVLIRGVTYNKAVARASNGQGMTGLLRANNIGAKVSFDGLVYVPSDLVDKEQILCAGDVLIAMSSGSKDLVGKAAIILKDSEFGFGAFCGAFRPMPSLRREFIRVVMQSPQYRDYVSDQGKGIGINNLTKGHIEDYEFFLPPPEEQTRIVAKVDELMALCDTLEAQQQVRRKLQNNLRQSTLQAVASATSPHELQTTWARLADNFGRLFHASEDLIDLDQCIKQLALKGLLSVRAEGEMVNSEIAELTRTSTACVLDTEMDWSIPDHWVWARCAWLGEARLGKMLDVAKNKGDFRPYLRNINVRWGRFNLSDVLQMRIQEHELSKVSVRKGDLVICEGGEPGRAAVWSGEEEFVIQKALHRFRCNEHVLPEYILFCLEHDYFSGRLSRYFTGATIKHLTGRALAEYTIPLPPVDEQKRILLAANELMHSVATLKERLIAGNRCAAALAAASVASLTGIAIEQERVTNPSEAEAAT